VAWLQRVVSNAVTDHYRRRASEARAMARFADEPGEGGSPNEDAPAERLRRDLAECLRPMLAQLGPEDREALELTDLGNLSQKEAAERLGIGHSAMKSRVQRARRRLYALLDACCQFEIDGRRAPIDAQIRREPCRRSP
jgi:RNA polymerase sigma-70 factor (ECF subfamily)